MLKKTLIFILLVTFTLINCVNVKSAENNLEIKNGYFSFTMPDETQGIYAVEKFDNGIYISEKLSKKSEAGGFAFGFKIYKSPKDYVGFDGYRKIGELTGKTGTIYDMVLIRPSEIFYGEGETIEKNYNRLYELAENIEIKGVNGNIYKKGQGMKGEDLYREVLKKYIKAVEENWNYSKCRNEGLGNIYDFSNTKNKKILKNTGYAYYDINNDGIDELFIGEIKKGKKSGRIFDVYTMVNRKPVHAKNGSGTDNLYVCSDTFLCSEIFESKNKNLLFVYSLENNSETPRLYVKYAYDANRNKTNPWFRNDNRISKEEYKNGKTAYSNYTKLDYIPLSEVK